MKRTIKKLALAVLLTGGLVTGFGSLAFAGGPHGHRGMGGPGMMEKLDGMTEQERLEFLEDRLDKRVAKMTANLELTKEQQVKVRQIMADAQTQLLEIYEQNKDVDDKTTAHGEAKAVFKQARQDVADILTDDQKARLKEQRAQRHEKFKGKMLERLDEKLGLSDSQRDEVQKILDDTHGKLRDLRQNATDEQAGRAEAKKLLKGAADQIDAVLDKEQKVQWAQMRERFEQHAGQRGPHGPHGKHMKRGEGKTRGAF